MARTLPHHSSPQQQQQQQPCPPPQLVNSKMSAYPTEQLVRVDPSSYSNGQFIKTVAFHADMTPDFETNIFTVVLDIKAKVQQDGVKVLSLDMSGQTVDSVELIDDLKGVPANTRVKWEANAETCPLGQRFIITLPARDLKKDDVLCYRINYQTSATASGAQFLPKETTKSGLYPFLYTQCQAIHARSLLILQDACSSKVAYTAAIRVATKNGPLMALMSAHPQGEPEVDGDFKVFNFEQTIPIPSYLFALTVGEIQKQPVSERCNVFAEPGNLKVAAREYEDLEVSLKVIESFCGDYRWGTYSVLSLPMGFGWGGMENPLVSYMSSTLLPLPRNKLSLGGGCGAHCPHFDDSSPTGDKLGLATSVAIHEQQHSWSGNLVTNESWQDFYLNEGLTVFCEWRTQRKLRGFEYESLHRMIGWEDLKESVAHYEEVGTPQFAQLIVNLENDTDPDDSFSSYPYMAGSAFFIYLEEIMGGPERFEPFVKAYFDHFAWGTVNSQQLKAFYLEYCNKNGYTERLSEIDWDTWFYKPGMPPFKPPVDMTLANAAYELADALANTVKAVTADEVAQKEEWVASKWSATQQTVFLDRLHSIFDERYTAANDEDKAKLQQHYLTTSLPIVKQLVDFGVSENCELFSRWLHLFLKAGAQPEHLITNQFDRDINLVDSLRFLLSSAGRMKFCRPTVRFMLKSKAFNPLTQDIFDAYRHQYHIVTANMIERDIKNQTVPLY